MCHSRMYEKLGGPGLRKLLVTRYLMEVDHNIRGRCRLRGGSSSPLLDGHSCGAKPTPIYHRLRSSEGFREQAADSPRECEGGQERDPTVGRICERLRDQAADPRCAWL